MNGYVLRDLMDNIPLSLTKKDILFGKSSYISLFSDTDCESYFNISINNEGHPLNDDNYSIDWQKEYVKITFLDYNGSPLETYRFYFSDFR